MPDNESEESRADAGRAEPSLELPSLGWRRRRRRAAEPAPAEPAPVEQAPADLAPEPETAPLPVVPVPEPTHAPEPATEAFAERVPEPVPAPVAVAEPPTELRVRRERRPGGMAAVVLTGLVVGLGIVGLTWASLRLCEGVQGTSSCGDTGYGLLIAIMAVMIVVGALLLRLARVPEPGSTSFLAVGLTAVLALLFLVDSLMDRPMVVVIPLLSAGTFALAHWVTRTFAGPAADARDDA